MIRSLSVFVLSALLFACTSSLSSNDQPEYVATGMLKTRNYIITLYATQGSPLYSVETLDGTVLQEDIPIETMLALVPLLPRTMISEVAANEVAGKIFDEFVSGGPFTQTGLTAGRARPSIREVRGETVFEPQGYTG